MGDRGNIVVQQAKGQRVYLYTHWQGGDIAKVARAALARRVRWSDPSYLARIIFCTLVSKDTWDADTGYGISTTICDNEHDILVVDTERQEVYYENDDGTRTATAAVTFAEFIK